MPASARLVAASRSTAAKVGSLTPIVPGSVMFSVGRLEAALGHVGEHRRDQRVAERGARSRRRNGAR